jgi:hypothetical protein
MAESQNGVTTDAITALIAAILALANALDKKGALSFEEYRDALLSMYRQMPHEDASGDSSRTSRPRFACQAFSTIGSRWSSGAHVLRSEPG